MSKKVAFKPITSAPASADAWIAEGGEREGRAPLQVVPEVPRKMVRFTLDVDAELHQRIKVACAMRGEKMSEVLRKVFEREFPRS